MIDAFSRQMSLPEIGREGQAKLCNSSALVVGVGGLGCAALPYLVASGIARIGMVDFDRVEESNLARQTLFGYGDVGSWKVEAAKKRLSHLNPKVHFQSTIAQLNERNAQELILDYDIILDGTDNLPARLAIDEACSCLQKTWVYGSISQWEGQVSLFAPRNFRYRTIFPEGTEQEPLVNCSSGGVLGPFVGLVGSIQAMEAIKWLAGIDENLSGKLLLVDGKNWRMTVAHIAPATPDLEISFSQLQKWQHENAVQLVDVRDANEKQNGDLGGSGHLHTSFSHNQKIVLYCQRGVRSLAFARRLRNEGFEAYSLSGGVNAVCL